MPENDREEYQPLVSVIMNCLNCEAFVKKALDSIYAQTYPHWEIIFWDNVSSDRTAEIVHQYDERLRYFRGSETVPLGEARNLALAEAKGELIAFLDTDDLWLPQKLARQVPLFRDPEVGLVYSDYYQADLNSGKRAQRFKGYLPPEGCVFEKFLIQSPLNMQTVMVRKTDRTFDTSLEVSEEYDYFLRLLLDTEARYVPEPLAVYHFHAGMASKRLNHLYPDEMAYILQKFQQEDSAFKEKYPEGFRRLSFKIQYWRAKVQMNEGRRTEAIRTLRRARGPVLQRIPLLVLALMGRSVWRWVHERTGHY
jgi:glycosyltransferase involved in cell wall biosynthesis